MIGAEPIEEMSSLRSVELKVPRSAQALDAVTPGLFFSRNEAFLPSLPARKLTDEFASMLALIADAKAANLVSPTCSLQRLTLRKRGAELVVANKRLC